MYQQEHEVSTVRSRLEILARILNVAEAATAKTHIMYRANLNYRELEKYLAFLGKKGMLQQVIDMETGTRR
jgi:predicted transcriptional regulator